MIRSQHGYNRFLDCEVKARDSGDHYTMRAPRSGCLAFGISIAAAIIQSWFPVRPDFCLTKTGSDGNIMRQEEERAESSSCVGTKSVVYTYQSCARQLLRSKEGDPV